MKKSFNIPNSPREKAKQKYVKYGEHSVLDDAGCGSIAWVVVWFWTLGFGLMTPKFNDFHAKEQNMTFATKVQQRVRDLFNPISNGWRVPLIQLTGDKYYIKYVYDESKAGKFDPRALWYVNMACLLVAAYWGIGVARAKMKQHRINRAQENLVDMMLDMPFIGVHDAKKVEKLMKIAPNIVANMSRDRRVYFDTLMNPSDDSNMRSDIINNDSICDMAIEIMVGHLQSHPEDMERAIRICADNDIPQNMLKDRMQNER